MGANQDDPLAAGARAQMKIAIVTTTIHVPKVLALYRRHAQELDFELEIFVAADRNTHPDCEGFCRSMDVDACYFTPDDQKAYACSELLGWSTDARRNIATLEALKWGADLFLFVDDDNAPLSSDFFSDLYLLFSKPFNGIYAKGFPWVEANNFLSPPSRQRGIPMSGTKQVHFGHILDGKAGVAQATILGDPDVNAVDRLNFPAPSFGVSELLRAGFVIGADSKTVFNTQATAVIRKLVPAMFIWPGSGTDAGVGRNADIYASLITQRVMRETGHVVHFGPPFVLQQRNQHNLIRDLRSELFAMEHIEEFADWLDNIRFNTSISTVEKIRWLYCAMVEELKWLPAGIGEAGQAWCDDIASVWPKPFEITQGPNYAELQRITRASLWPKETPK